LKTTLERLQELRGSSLPSKGTDLCREKHSQNRSRCAVPGNGAAHAQDKTKWPSPNFIPDCRRDRLSIYFDKEDYEEVMTDLRGGKDGTDENRVGVRIPFDKEARTRLGESTTIIIDASPTAMLGR
jgi:hypothetical protein